MFVDHYFPEDPVQERSWTSIAMEEILLLLGSDQGSWLIEWMNAERMKVLRGCPIRAFLGLKLPF